MKRIAAVLLAATLLPSTLAAQQEVLDRIQRQCLRAYTPEMLEELYGSEELPPAARGSSKEAIDAFIDVLEVEKGRFFPFLLEDLQEAFELWVKPGTRFLDLGSGDGRVAFYAATLGADATGIEYDPQVFGASERARDALGDVLAGRDVTLIQDDFFNHSWAGYDVVFYFDLGAFEQHRLRKKIFYELDPGARLIVGHQRVPFPGLELETTFPTLHVYRQPETIADYDPKLREYAEAEVRELYAFFEDWYNGRIEASDENLARYGDVLSAGFQGIDPRGVVMTRNLALEILKGSHGRWQAEGKDGGTIRIENLTLRFIVDSVVTMTFDEHHEVRGAKQYYKTTAIFRVRYGKPNNVEWLHAHQSDLRLIIRQTGGS